MLQTASDSQRGINFRLKPCVLCHYLLLHPFCPAVTVCQRVTVGRGALLLVGIIKTSYVYTERSQSATREIEHLSCLLIYRKEKQRHV